MSITFSPAGSSSSRKDLVSGRIRSRAPRPPATKHHVFVCDAFGQPRQRKKLPLQPSTWQHPAGGPVGAIPNRLTQPTRLGAAQRSGFGRRPQAHRVGSLCMGLQSSKQRISRAASPPVGTGPSSRSGRQPAGELRRYGVRRPCRQACSVRTGTYRGTEPRNVAAKLLRRSAGAAQLESYRYRHAVNSRSYYEDYWSVQGFNPETGVHPTASRMVEPHLRGTCLDFGCGAGGKAAWVSSRVNSYIGVDISETAVARVRESGFDAVRVDDTLPFDDQSFDVALAFDVLEHLFQPQLALAEMIRVLKPGGTVLCSVPNAAYWRRRVDAVAGRWNPMGDDMAVEAPWRDPHIRFFTVAALARLLRGSGAVGVHVEGYGGAVVRDVPGLRRLASKPSRLYRALERQMPSVMAHTLLGSGRK